MIRALALPYPNDHLEDLYSMSHSKLSKFGGPLHVLLRRLGAKSPPERPWVAQIRNGKLKFMQGKKDYTAADGIGESGVVVRYYLPPGEYVVFDYAAGKRRVTVQQGDRG